MAVELYAGLYDGSLASVPLENVALGDVVEQVPVSFSFQMAVEDCSDEALEAAAGAGDWYPLNPWVNEVYLVDGTDVLFWGPVTAWSDDNGIATFQCEWFPSHLAHVFIDRGANRVNLLTDSPFEDVSTGWATSHSPPDVTAELLTGKRILGSKSLKLTGTLTDEDTYIAKTITYTASGLGDLVTLVVWYLVETFTGEANGSLGVLLRQTDSPDAGVVYYSEDAVAYIDGDTPRGVWQRVEVTTWVPPNATRDLEVRLYSIDGVVWYDALQMVLMESLAVPEDSDQAEIAEAVVAFAQDPTVGKVDLGIGAVAPPTGLKRGRAYQYADHHNAYDALMEFPRLDDGFGLWWTPNREVEVCHPRKGVDRSVPRIAALMEESAPDAWWRLADLSEENGLFPLTNNGATFVAGLADTTDGAAHFDGTQWLETNAFTLPMTGDVTIVGKFAVEAVGGSARRIVSKGSTSAVDWGVAVTTGSRLQFFFVDTGGTSRIITSTAAVNVGEHTFAGRWDGSELTLLVDGVEAAAPVAGAWTPRDSGSNLRIGRGTAAGPTNFYQGTLDEIAIYERFLTDEEGEAMADEANLRPSGVALVDQHNEPSPRTANCHKGPGSVDGRQGASDVVALGTTSGPGREEGGARDTAGWGGLVVQKVFQPTGTPPIDALPALARGELARVKDPDEVEVTVLDPVLARLIGFGDDVALDVGKGKARRAGVYRVVRKARNPLHAHARLTLNPAA